MIFDNNRLTFSGCNTKRAPMPHHIQGLSFTASGYGSRIPTELMVWHEGFWRRVYCCIFSNIGTCYIIRGRKPAVATIVDIAEAL
jgi:hypothetical protein